MAYITGTTADIVEAQKSARSSLYGGKKWEEYFLQPTQQYYQSAGEAAQQQTAYDISQAYANYKQQELALLQQQQLGTGFKEQQASALQSQYNQTYSGLKSTELQNLMNVESEYQTTLAKEEERLAKQAEQYKKLDKAVQDLFEENKGKIKNFKDVENFSDLFEVDETGTKNLSERGKLFYEMMLRGGDIDVSEYDEKGELVGERKLINFADYLSETDDELYEIYMNDPQFAQQILGGLEYGDRRYSEEEQTKVENYAKIGANEKKESELSEKYDYNKNNTPTFDNPINKEKYLQTYEAHAQGDWGKIVRLNRDDVKTNMVALFGGDKNRWTFDELVGGGIIVYYDNRDDKINRENVEALGKQLGLKIKTGNNDAIGFEIHNMNAQKLAKIISILSGAIKI